MSNRDHLESLYSRLGPPELSNFAPSDLPDDLEYTYGAFTVADHNGTVVLIRRTPIKRYPGIENYWWVPGGAKEGNEKLDQTAIREFAEETGLRITIDRILMAHLPEDNPSFIAHTFRGAVLDGVISSETDPDGITAQAKRFAPYELESDDIWMDEDKLLLAREGFISQVSDDLVAKLGLQECGLKI